MSTYEVVNLTMEIALADQAKKTAADAQFKKLQRAADGKRAMSEYEAEQAAGYARTAKLKAARLEREASAPPAPPPVAKPVKAPRAKKAK
jgi:hypothetical protein